MSPRLSWLLVLAAVPICGASSIYYKESGKVLARGGAAATTHFNATFSSNGLTVADPAVTWNVTGVTAPDVAWWADDPLGSSGYTTKTFTEVGATTSSNTTFCTDGSWNDLSSGCMTAREFDGSDGYTTSGSEAPCAGDCSICVVGYHPSGQAGGYMASQFAWPPARGWVIYSDSSDAVYFYVAGDAGDKQINAATIGTGDGAWFTFCGAFDQDGDMEAYKNGVKASFFTHSVGTINATAGKLGVGYRPQDANFKYNGWLSAVWYWDSFLSATDVAELHEYFSGQIDSANSSRPTFSKAPNCCWVAGKIACFGINWPNLGCEQPPGNVNPGEPSGGILAKPAITNYAVGSRDIDTYWTDSGTPTPTATSTDLFYDTYKQTQRITDDDGAAVEYVHQTIDITALNTGDKVSVCLYAKDSTGTVLDVQVREETGGSCTAGDVDFTQATVTTSWSEYEFTHTVVDGDCTDLILRVAPTSFATVGDTGSVEFVTQVFLGIDYCPPLYAESTAAAVSAGDDAMTFDVSGIAAIADVAEGTVVKHDFTPHDSSPLAADGFFFEIADTATAVDYWRGQWASDGKIYMQAQSTEEGAERELYVSNAAWSPTAGQTYSFRWRLSASMASLQIDGGAVAGTNTASIANLPDSLDTLGVLTLDNGAIQQNGYMENFQVEK